MKKLLYAGFTAFMLLFALSGSARADEVTITFSPASGSEVEENAEITINCSNTELELKYMMVKDAAEATSTRSLWSYVASVAQTYSETNKPTVTSENPYLLVSYEEDGTAKFAEASYTIKSEGGEAGGGEEETPAITVELDPVAGSAVEENTSITIASSAETTIVYRLFSSSTMANNYAKESYWGNLTETYSAENKPAITKSKPHLTVGYLDGDTKKFIVASYTIKVAVEKPTFSVAAGRVPRNTTVEITSATEDAKIYYTTDGTAPTASSTEYTAAITIDQAMTIKAIAVKDDKTSEESSVTYTIQGEEVIITFSPESGSTVEENTPVTITYSKGDAPEYKMYASASDATMDRMLWSFSASGKQTYSETNKPVVTKETPYLLVAYKEIDENNALKFADATYTINEGGEDPGGTQVAAPTIEPGSGRYQRGSYITIECSTPGAKIWYKIGSNNWKEYKKPTSTYISDYGEVIFQACATKEGMANSDTVSVTYFSTVQKPRIELIAGEIHIKTSTVGSTNHYQINSGDWKDTTKDIRIVYDTCYTITAYATKDDCPNSDTITVVFNSPKVDNPNFSAKHAVLANTPVTLSTKNTAAEIYYAKDASESWTKYTEPIVITENCLIRAYAAKEGLLNSDTMAIEYRIVTFTPAPGEVEDNTSVSISCAPYTAGESISFAYKLYADKATAGQDQSFFTSKTTYSENKKPVITASKLFLRCEVTIKDQTSTYAPYVDAVYTIKKDIPMPIITPAGGEVEKGTEVEIKLAEGVAEGVKILYTVNDSLPVAGKDYTLEYTQKIVVNEAMTIKAMAFKAKTGDETRDLVSNVAEASFTVKETPVVPDTVKTPTFNPAAGEVEKDAKVAIACATEGAKIYYTVDGSVPTAESTEYTAAITIDKAMTVKAIAIKEGMVNSKVAEAAYTVKETTNEGNELAGVRIYPNPTDGEFNVEVPAKTEVEVFNIAGVVVKRLTVAEGTTLFRLEDSGIYFVRFTANGQVTIKKVVVR